MPLCPSARYDGLADGFELAVAYTLDDRTFVGVGTSLENDNAMAIGAKYVTPWAPAGFALAVGAQVAAQDADGTTVIDSTTTTLSTETTATQAYLVGTRQLMADRDALVSLNGTLGVNWTKVERESTTGPAAVATLVVGPPVPTAGNTTVSSNESAFRLLLGLEAEFANGLRAAVEFQTKNSDLETDALSSIVVRYPFTPALTGQVGYSNAGFGLLGSDDHNLFTGISYAFGAAE